MEVSEHTRFVCEINTFFRQLQPSNACAPIYVASGKFASVREAFLEKAWVLIDCASGNAIVSSAQFQNAH